MTVDRLAREEKTVTAMMRIYCRDMRHVRLQGKLCQLCSQLRDYSAKRLERCVFGTEKPTCARCPVHCYWPEMRRQITEVMRHAGPRMIFRHPVLAIRHILDNKKALSAKVRVYQDRKAATKAASAKRS